MRESDAKGSAALRGVLWPSPPQAGSSIKALKKEGPRLSRKEPEQRELLLSCHRSGLPQRRREAEGIEPLVVPLTTGQVRVVHEHGPP